MPRYMLFLHQQAASDNAMSPDEIQAVINEYKDWSQRLGGAGQLVGGEKLTNDHGRHLKPDGSGVMVSDGPFAETKELIGGYFEIEAADYDQAVELSRDCPHLKFGGWIEVRQVDVT